MIHSIQKIMNDDPDFQKFCDEWQETVMHGFLPNEMGCAHLWKYYLGLTEKYYYCIKCDEKDYKCEK